MEIGDADNKRYLVNNVRGYLPTTIISFVMNLHPEARPIFFSRHGQSVYNLEDRIGGDSSLTEYGLQYARKLGQRIAELEELRRRDKLGFRYPQCARAGGVRRRGESYIDIIDRLQPVVFELERCTQPIIVVSHQAVLRCLLAYFLDIPREKIPFISLRAARGLLTALPDPVPHAHPHRAPGLLLR